MNIKYYAYIAVFMIIVAVSFCVFKDASKLADNLQKRSNNQIEFAMDKLNNK